MIIFVNENAINDIIGIMYCVHIDLVYPGAGLSDAWDQAEAAYADLIMTSQEFSKTKLSEKDMKDLSRGGEYS